MRALPIMAVVARRVCGVGESSRRRCACCETNMNERVRVSYWNYSGTRDGTHTATVSCDEPMHDEVFQGCRGVAEWQHPDKEKNLEKKSTHRPRKALAGVEAKSTCDVRRNRDTCMLEQDAMHAASDHGRRPTTRMERVCPLGGRKAVSVKDSWRVLARLDCR